MICIKACWEEQRRFVSRSAGGGERERVRWSSRLLREADCKMGNPKSFKISINSPLAITLKSSISHKLLEFLGNYSDDVLAEYITVLVCNGKHQNQARDDLEAFLGDRSGEFVSWLWDLLLYHVNRSKTSAVPLDTKGAVLSSSHDQDDDKEYRAEKSRDLDNHGTSKGDGSPVISTTGEELHGPSTLLANTALSEAFQRLPSADVNIEKVSLLAFANDTQRKPEPEEYIYDNLLENGYSRKDSFIDRPVSGEKGILKILDSKTADMPKELLSPSKQRYPGRLQSRIEENPFPRRSSAANSPKVATAVSQQYKSRVSVWDRLGNSHENKIGRNKNVHASHTSFREQNGVHIKGETPGLGNGASTNNSGKDKKFEGDLNSNGKLNGAAAIRRKRHFGENGTGPGDPKRSKLVEEVSEATTISQKMSDMKARVNELERELSDLRSKQSEVTRGGKPDLSIISGTLKHPGECIEPRTVHFAVTKEALSNHFAKCGSVVSVVIMTVASIAQSRRSAFITFASMESVNKALALSGTSFFSRTIKVFRKADMATGKSPSTRGAGSPVQARTTHIRKNTSIERPLYPSTHLQWRREPVSGPSEAPAPAKIPEKESVSSPSKSAASANVQENIGTGSGSPVPQAP